jgi:hypothetical protein
MRKVIRKFEPNTKQKNKTKKKTKKTQKAIRNFEAKVRQVRSEPKGKKVFSPRVKKVLNPR